MNIIQYQNPEISDNAGIIKPLALESTSLPYNDISDRRFEELTYSAYKILIKEKKFYSFDSISLMTGVRDQGKDCALFSNGISTGVIQCKKYTKNFSKQLFGEEITKFVLYSLLDNRMIPDPKNFSYFIAVSKGFVLECSDFIDDFNRLILEEENLADWVNKNLKNPTIKSLGLIPSTVENVREILSVISIKKIHPQDLDEILMLPSLQHLQALFFQVRSLVSEKAVHQLHDTFKNSLNKVLDHTALKRELQKGSASLYVESNEFDDLPDSHLDRSETKELLEWVTKKCSKDKFDRSLNVSLLAGNAGMGKTVILKDLYDKLIGLNIPVLALKADKLQSANMQELQHKIGLGLPIENLIEQCKEQYNTTVIIIDQIDALSQSMSTNRNYLESFQTLIGQFSYDSNVRIIISVRLFDLYYDPSLKIYKNLKTIKVGLLKEEQVFNIISRKGINKNNISSKLLQLLRTPNHLNIYLRVSSPELSKLSINSLYDLYTELYNSKINLINHSAPVKPQKVKKLLFKIADQMFNEQAITVSRLSFENFINELNYLESERLVKSEERQLQFFHQTFYDYIFAKQFVENNNNLIGYIKESHQSILIRSAVKMILNYLREYSFRKYLNVLQELFSDHDIYFHIKHMCFSILTHQDNIKEEETGFAVNVASLDINYRFLLFENAKTDIWLKAAIEKNLILDSINHYGLDNRKIQDSGEVEHCGNAAISFLQIFLNRNLPEAWNIISKIENESVKQKIIYWIDNCADEKFIQLFEQCPNLLHNDPYGYYSTLHKISKNNPQYAFNIIKDDLFQKPWDEIRQQTQHIERKLLSSLAKTLPWKAAPILINVLLESIEKEAHFYLPFYDDHIFTGTGLYKNKPQDNYEFYYKLLADCLRDLAASENIAFKIFLEQHLTSRFEAILRLIIYAFVNSESLYRQEIFKLFNHFYENNRFLTASDLGAEFRDLLQKTFPHFNISDQNTIIDLILNLKVTTEARVLRYDTRLKPHFNWGQTQHILLSRISSVVSAENLSFKKRFQELNRKFPEFKEKYTSGRLIASMIHCPVPEDAYEKMTPEQWLKSFRKYHSERDPFSRDSRKGGMHELLWAFKSYAGKNPDRKICEIIKSAANDQRINYKYPFFGMIGLMEGHYEPRTIHQLFYLLKPLVDNSDKLIFDFSIRTASYIIKSDIEDDEIFDYLVKNALDYNSSEILEYSENETSDDDLILKGRKTSYGEAAKALLRITNKKYSETVFTTVEKILFDGPLELKAVILNRFAYLNNIDRDRSFELFSRYILSENNILLSASSLWSLQYMIYIDFKRFTPVFEELVSSEKLGKDDSELLFLILYSSYIYDEKESEKLLFDLVSFNRYTTRWAFQVIFKNFYHNQKSPEKANVLLAHLMKIISQNPLEKLEITYSGLDEIELIDIENFLNNYISSPNFTLSTPLIDYFTLQCNKFSHIAVDLFNKSVKKDKSSSIYENRLDRNDESVKFIVGAFNALKSDNKKTIKLRRKLLENFDSILKDHRFRRPTEKILDELV